VMSHHLLEGAGVVVACTSPPEWEDVVDLGTVA